MDVNKQIIEKGLINKNRARIVNVYIINFFRAEVGTKKINQRVAYRYTLCSCLEARIENLITYKGTNVL
jgi:hypothetical protein